jgi:hypothetical protein
MTIDPQGIDVSFKVILADIIYYDGDSLSFGVSFNFLHEVVGTVVDRVSRSSRQ